MNVPPSQCPWRHTLPGDAIEGKGKPAWQLDAKSCNRQSKSKTIQMHDTTVLGGISICGEGSEFVLCESVNREIYTIIKGRFASWTTTTLPFLTVIAEQNGRTENRLERTERERLIDDDDHHHVSTTVPCVADRLRSTDCSTGLYCATLWYGAAMHGMAHARVRPVGNHHFTSAQKIPSSVLKSENECAARLPARPECPSRLLTEEDARKRAATEHSLPAEECGFHFTVHGIGL